MACGNLRYIGNMSESIQLRVMDFDCPTCASNVERSLIKMGGVQNAEVHFTTGRVQVEYDGTAVDTEKIERTIEKQGYTPQQA